MQGGQGEKLRELIEKASQDASKGVAWAMERVVVVGRKGEVMEDDSIERAGEVADVGVGDGKSNVESGGDGKGGAKKGRKRESWLKVWKRLGFGRGR